MEEEKRPEIGPPAGEMHVECPLLEEGDAAAARSSKLEEFFPGQRTEHEEDLNLQWLSFFLEDCLCSTPTPSHHLYRPPPISPQQTAKPKPATTFASIPVRPRSKRKRTAASFTYSPLLQQSQWLAESELLLPTGGHHQQVQVDRALPQPVVAIGTPPPKRCSHCQSQKTPQWREGPMGPKTLCNACGVRFRKGRLLPEYRPAKSPTFQSCKHSNSHRKVMEMRRTMSGVRRID